jgi:hypothetical protein
MAYIFTLDSSYGAFIEDEGVDRVFEHCVDRSDFLTEFSATDFSNTRQLSYEPDRELFHIVELDYSITELSSATDDPRMAYIHNNIEAIKTWFVAKELEQTQPPAE